MIVEKLPEPCEILGAYRVGARRGSVKSVFWSVEYNVFAFPELEKTAVLIVVKQAVLRFPKRIRPVEPVWLSSRFV